MLVYLDSVICIYAVEGSPSFLARARARLAALATAGDQPAFSDLTWLECRVKPIRTGDAAALADMEAFLNAADVIRVPMTTGRARSGRSTGSSSAIRCTWPRPRRVDAGYS